MSVFSEILSGNGFFMASKALTRRFNLITSAIYGQLASSYESFDEKNLLTVIEGKFYFYLDQEWICEETNLSPYMVRNAMKDLQDAGLVIVKRYGMPAKNFYHLTDVIDDVMRADKQEQNEKKLARYREREEKKRKKPDAIKETLKQYEAFLNGQQQDPPHVKEQQEQQAAEIGNIEDLLPEGMNMYKDLPNVPSVEVSEPARPAAPNKQEIQRQVEAMHYVWREEKFDLLYEYLTNGRKWSAEFVADVCLTLERLIDPSLVSIMDIDAGLYDYKHAPKKVNKPSRFIGTAIARRVEERYINQGINMNELEQNMQNASFIENVRSIRPHDPIVLAYDARQLQKEKELTFK